MNALALHLFALLACSGSRTSPSETPVVVPDPVEAPAAPAPAEANGAEAAPVAASVTGAELMAAGACADSGVTTPADITPQWLTDGREVLLVTCEHFAYQSTFEYWSPAPLLPLLTSTGATLGGLGLATMEADGTVDWLEKSRGAGDCGTFHSYVPSADGWVLKAKRSQECGDGGEEPISPASWPLVAGSGVLKGLQNGDRGCYVVLEDDTTIIGEFDLCSPESEALIGKSVALELTTANTQSPECEGDPECSLSISEQVVVSLKAL